MAIQKILARGWKFEVESSTPGTYLEVKGLEQIEFSGDDSTVDTTDFNSSGWAEHMVAERKSSVSVEAQYLEDPSTGDRDPGQERVEAIAVLIGNSSLGHFKLTSPGGTIKSFSASAKMSTGGSRNDVTSWKSSFEVSGQITIT
jgi:hypothetical protein